MNIEEAGSTLGTPRRAAPMAVWALLLACPLGPLFAGVPSEGTQRIARRAVESHGEEAIATLGDLVAFETVHREGMDNAAHPEFRAMTAYLADKARRLGFDFEDHGAVVILGLGDSPDRLGIVIHGDVQPADPARWAKSPFLLDAESEPGRLVGRGTEDDKGPLACALYAMKALADHALPLARRIELIVTYTEESDWDPILEFLAQWDPPALNIAFDASYPVVVAEKGWGSLALTFPERPAPAGGSPWLERISGGSFLAQVPEAATAVIAAPTPELEAALRTAAEGEYPVEFELAREDSRLVVRARGLSAHSSTPWEGRNAIAWLASLLGGFDWPDTAAARFVRLAGDLVGTGDLAERFGDLGYSHPFMGPLTLTLATVGSEGGTVVAGLSFRRPAGRSAEEVTAAAEAALEGWKRAAGAGDLAYELEVGDPYLIEDAPHVPVLLDVFRHYTGIQDAQPVAIGGGTNARLLPNGVSFGPSMPGRVYTGHSEHEFIDRERFLQDLEMYTAALAELAGR